MSQSVRDYYLVHNPFIITSIEESNIIIIFNFKQLKMRSTRLHCSSKLVFDMDFEKEIQNSVYLQAYIQQNMNNLYNHKLFEQFSYLENQIKSYFIQQERILTKKKDFLIFQIKQKYQECLQVVQEKIAHVFKISNLILEAKQAAKKYSHNHTGKGQAIQKFQSISSLLGSPLKKLMQVPELPSITFTKNIEQYLNLCFFINTKQQVRQIQKSSRMIQSKQEQQKTQRRVKVLQKLNNYSKWS